MPSAPEEATIEESTSIVPLHTALEKRLLSRDVLTRHVDAYFVYLYPLPGYDFFHRTSMLEDLHNDQITPILSTALCASVAMYVSRSKESRQISVEWARETDAYILSNLNSLNVLNLQVIVLSMFHHFVYRQFGRVWLMHGLATRLVVGLQMNSEASVGAEGAGVASRECLRRLAWAVFVHDKLHCGGVEEFVALPSHWMRIRLPLNENDFRHEQDRHVQRLDELDAGLSCEDLGISGYMVMLARIRYPVLKYGRESLTETKVVILTRESTINEAEAILAPISRLQGQLEAFLAGLPPHLTLSDRNILAHSATPEFVSYLSLHMWYFQCCCDVFRICLPGVFRESAPASLLANVPGDLVPKWRSLAVSCALKMASTWQRLLEMRATGALSVPGDLLALSPAGCVSIYQCTKILLIAKRYKLYSGILDPLSGVNISLDDDKVGILCQSNVSFLNELAAIAPIAAVIQHDIKEMIDMERRSTPATLALQEYPPVSSSVQQDKLLSRYNILAMGVAASSESGFSQASSTASPVASFSHSPRGQAPCHDTQSSAQRSAEVAADGWYSNASDEHQSRTLAASSTSRQQEQRYEHQRHGPVNHAENVAGFGIPEVGRSDSSHWANIPLSGLLASEYTVTASPHDMGGELDWFLMNSILDQQAEGHISDSEQMEPNLRLCALAVKHKKTNSIASPVE
ncbi:hypothetical protein GQ53DRAFT_832140 [Thozetella sp. PMI_491]|nr:hypothetical protein GQ53DRAFT_832140 [Thozetella sp. PMI_491]